MAGNQNDLIKDDTFNPYMFLNANQNCGELWKPNENIPSEYSCYVFESATETRLYGDGYYIKPSPVPPFIVGGYEAFNYGSFSSNLKKT